MKAVCPECLAGKHQVDLSSPCIPSINKPNPTTGYALRVIDGRRVYEHVAAWEQHHGIKVPEGMVIDHLCHDPQQCQLSELCPHRGCRNPLHLAVVTRGENVARADRPSLRITRCPQGHPYSPENTYVYPGGNRACRTCRREFVRRCKAKKKGLANAADLS